MKKIGEIDVEAAALAPYPVGDQNAMPKVPSAAYSA